jgi:hypothetical protein
LGETNSVAPDTRRPIGIATENEDGPRASRQDLTEDEQRQVEELKRRDQEVRRHEQAHLAAAGRYARGGPQFEFTTGPDGRQYATGGHVSIDVSPANTPEATLLKAQMIRRAALAPAEPSGADRAVASAASQLETEARRQIQEARQAEANGADEGEGTGAVGETPALQAPPALPKREFSEYVPDAGGERGGGGGAISGVRRLDVLA